MQSLSLADSASRIAIALALGAPAVSAQAFNLDVGDATTVGSPASTYGAAAGQAGVWFALFGDPPYVFDLVDVNGVQTSVQSECIATGGTGDYHFDNGLTQGDDEKLVDDAHDIGSGVFTSTWIFRNLQDGPYLVYTYAIAPDSHTYRTRVVPEGSTDEQFIGGFFPGGHAHGVSYALHCVDVVGGELRMHVDPAVGFGTCNGFQLVPISTSCTPEPGTRVCDCAAPGSAPCGNEGAPEHGCGNSFDGDGARLGGTGTTQPDTVVLAVVGAAANQPGLFFQGSALVNGGDGLPFGDGLRCAGAAIRRLEVRMTDATGSASTTVSISTLGAVGPGSGARYYQLWYRDPIGGPCGTGFNVSNAYEVIW